MLVLQFAFGMRIVKANVCHAMESAWKIAEQLNVSFCFFGCALWSAVQNDGLRLYSEEEEEEDDDEEKDDDDNNKVIDILITLPIIMN